MHQVKEFAPDLSFGGSASHPGLVALALSEHWPAMRDAVTVLVQNLKAENQYLKDMIGGRLGELGD